MRSTDIPFCGNESLIIPFLKIKAFSVTLLPVLERILAQIKLETTHFFQKHESYSETVWIRMFGLAVTTYYFQETCSSSGCLTHTRQQHRPRKTHHNQHAAVQCMPYFLDKTLLKFRITNILLAYYHSTTVCLNYSNCWHFKHWAETSCYQLHNIPNTGGVYSLLFTLFWGYEIF